MSEQITFLDALVETIKRAGNYNKNDQAPPDVVLWTDKDRQWEALLPLLRDRLPILTFGPYNPSEWTGPAYWLRCVIARALPDYLIPMDITPIIYLPGISKQEIRAIEDTPKMLQPLAELQYRGVLWTHKNGRDWTISAFIQSRDNGLGIEVEGDATTRGALQRALLKLADEPIERMKREAPLRASFFDTLLHPDEVRTLLLWLNDPSGYPKRYSATEWASFCELCKRKYHIHPEKDGVVTAATHLGQHDGEWQVVWNRYKEAPHSYPHLPERLHNAGPQQLSLIDLSESWPQHNETAETKLREDLLNLNNLLPQEVRSRIDDLEKEHTIRRSWVWTKLGRSPLANALQYLVVLAKETEQMIGGTTIQEISMAYTKRGWKADAAVIDSLTAVEQPEDVDAIKVAIMVLYRPWLEHAASTMQKVAYAGPPSQTYAIEALPEIGDGTCVLFCDGLRYDVGQQLIAELETHSMICKTISHLVPLPSITATAKPAISPVEKLLSGNKNSSLVPVVTASGSKVNAEVLRKVLEQNGYQVLRGEELGDPSGKGWTEIGTIDSYGHQYGWRLTHHIQDEIANLKRRTEMLLSWGWKHVVVVTDHGWLLLPGNLPKAELPEHLTQMRKGRCAQLKETANIDQETMPWYWDSDIRIALAPNICCYEAGKEYEHGGLSPQECIVPVITVAQTKNTQPQHITIERVTWKGLRCTMDVIGTTPGMKVDIRTKAGDEKTSLVTTSKALNADGSISLLVQDEDRIGEAAQIVIFDSSGTICKQILITVGG